jgi:Carboxypeptidase regulatory-like domain
MMKQLRRWGGTLAVLLTTHNLAAQQVLGRAVREVGGSPLLEALIVLLDDSGREQARTVTSATGGFELRAPQPGRYRLRVQQIGQRSWETPTFDLTGNQTSQRTLRVPDQPFELHELSASARRPNCAITLGDATLGANLLQAAQTSLALAEAEISRGKRSYETETYRRVVPVVGPPEDSVVVQDRLTGWPIQSADPDSLRKTGFVQGDWPAPSPMNDRPETGPTYFGPDARVLFTDWFLGSHCISVETSDRDDSSSVVARFKPAKGTHAAAALQGSLEFDRHSLTLHSLHFQFAARPRWAPSGSAGGEIQFGRLPDGAWVPVRWQLRAPVPKVVGEVPRYRLFGVVETGGRVAAVYDAEGKRDRAAEAALNVAAPD